MSIFAGEFKDGAGVAFDPHSYAHAGQGNSQVMQRRYFTNTNKTWRGPHSAALRRLRGLWHNDLLPADRALWLAESILANPARDYASGIQDKGFVAFANCNWPVVYGYGGTYQKSPSVDKAELLTLTLDDADSATQGIVWTMQYWAMPVLELPAVTYVYQVDPARLTSRRFARMTRLLLTFDGWIEDELSYQVGHAGQWWFGAGDTVKIVARHRPSSTYQTFMWDSIVAV